MPTDTIERPRRVILGERLRLAALTAREIPYAFPLAAELLVIATELEEGGVLEDPVRITIADRWQMVARNLAQSLIGIADWCDELQCDTPPTGLQPDDLRGAFPRQCTAHGLRVG